MKKSDFGIIGLGVMGKNLALNIADKGHSLSVFNRSVEGEFEIANNFLKDNPSFNNITACTDLKKLTLSLKKPRKILVMIKAGNAIDILLKELIPFLEEGDLIIDGGNSYFLDTIRRSDLLKTYNLLYIGVGISGGEKGARNGPSIMPGGTNKSYSLASNVLESIAAKDKMGSACCSLLGPEGSGHFIKMVHNGIEYAEMQLLAEMFALMTGSMNYKEMAMVFEEWNKGELSGYLLDITIKILRKKEDGRYVLDTILDKADNKGTGSWSSKIAFDLGIPNTMMASAVFARYISSFKKEREFLSKNIEHNTIPSKKINLDKLKEAYDFARFINHSQGFDLIKQASNQYSWHINLNEVARIWTNGCILKSVLMNKLQNLLKKEDNLLQSEFGFGMLKSNERSISDVLKYGLDQRVALHCFGSALNFWMDMTNKRGPANLIQAQRDFFGSHGFVKKDDVLNEMHHCQWEEQNNF